MTTKTFSTKRLQRANRNLTLKLALEKRFAPEINRYFNQVSRHFKVTYAATGKKLSKASYAHDTKVLLKDHYLRVSKAFRDELRLNLKTISFKKEDTPKEDHRKRNALIAAALLLYIAARVKTISALLDDTTEGDMADAISKAKETLKSDGVPITDLSVALLAGKLLKDSFEGRTDTIAATETQAVSETTKRIESDVILNEDVDSIDVDELADGNVDNVVGTKVWTSILDNRTRTGEFNHVEADGQEVPTNEPFIVSGEELMFPGDTSLGASLGNVINCRCSANYSE